MRILCLLAIPGLLLLSSCGKDGNIVPVAPLSTLKQLSFSNISTSATLPPGPAQAYFYYDSYDRVTNVFIYRGNPNIIVPPTDTLLFMLFNYNGSENLPVMAVQRSRLNSGSMTGVDHHFSYDITGHLTQDSVFYPNTNSSSNFYYRYGVDYGISTVGLNPASAIKLDSCYVVNGNMISLYETNFAGPPQPDFSYRFEHDANTNPFDKLNIAPGFSSFSINPKNPFNIYLEEMLPVFGKNNTREVKYYENGILKQTHTLWYTYNGEGLPLQRIWSHDNPTTVSDTLSYIY